MRAEFFRRLKAIRKRMLRRVSDAHGEYIDEVLAAVPVDDDTRALADGIDAIAEAEGFDQSEPEGRRALYLHIIGHCPDLKELAHAATEKQAGLTPSPVPVIVNGRQCGLKELGNGDDAP
jgi:hypothetical protein